MNKKHKKVCRVLNYIEHFPIQVSTATGCVPISEFTSLVGICVGNTSSAIELKICVTNAGIKKYQPVVMKKKKKHKIVLLARSKLNSIEILLSKALIELKVMLNFIQEMC